MPIGHSVKTSFRIIYEVSILHVCTVSNPLPLRRILDHGNTPDHNWKLKTEKKFAVGFDEMWYWFQDEAGPFSCNLDAGSSDNCVGRFKSRIKSFISAWSNKKGGNSQQLLLKRSTDMSSSVEVEEYLSVSSSSRPGRQLNTGLGASTKSGTGLKAELKFGYWSRSLFCLLKSYTFTIQKWRYATWSICSECQKEGAYLFHGAMISKFPHSLYRLYV